MIFNIIGILIGISIMITGIYYLIKEGSDKESKKIYGITTAAGIIILIAMIVKILAF